MHQRRLVQRVPDKDIAGYVHDLAGFRDIAEFFSQIQQTRSVFDDSIVSI